MSSSAIESTGARDALVERIFMNTIGAFELMHVYIGDRLGLYQALADRGPLDAGGLASAAGINRRYAREWLEQQAVAGLIEVSTDASDGDARQYRLPPEHAEVLLNADSLYYQSPAARVTMGIAGVMPQVLKAFKTGGGVPFEDYGADVREGIAAGNRPMFLKLLGTLWLPAVPDVDQRLRSEPPARVADFGCGVGNSTMALAHAYPLVELVGIDLDAASIATAKKAAKAAGLADRVRFERRDAADPSLAGQFDLVTAFETVHDMADPVGALRAMRGLIRDGGSVVIADERVAEQFTAPGDELERYLYGFSAVHCLAAAMGDPASAMTGTMMRPETLRKYASDAGFARVEILPIENDVWRFYRLYP